MLPGDDEASVFTDGAYCQRFSDLKGSWPDSAHAPLPRHGVSGCWANCRGKRRWFRALRDGRTRVREPWPARYVQPGSFASRAPGLPRQSLPCVLVSRAQSSRAVWAEVILQVRELHGDRQRIFAVFYVLDVIGVRLDSLLAREQCHRSNDPNRYTSREQIVRGVRAIFYYIVKPRDRFGIIAFHQVDHPFDVLNVGVAGALLGLAGVGLARNILGKQEERAGLRYCSDRQ
jgi:hypothetical protein